MNLITAKKNVLETMCLFLGNHRFHHLPLQAIFVFLPSVEDINKFKAMCKKKNFSECRSNSSTYCILNSNANRPQSEKNILNIARLGKIGMT